MKGNWGKNFFQEAQKREFFKKEKKEQLLKVMVLKIPHCFFKYHSWCVLTPKVQSWGCLLPVSSGTAWRMQATP